MNSEKLLSYKTPKTWLLIVIVILLIIIAIGCAIIYKLDHPIVEVRYIDRVITNEKVVTVKEYEDIEWYYFEATGYSACDPLQGTTNITATGKKVECGMIAVDPDVIPLGSKVEIKDMGNFTADDTGGDINKNRVDIYFNTKKEANEFGRQGVWVRILEEE